MQNIINSINYLRFILWLGVRMDVNIAVTILVLRYSAEASGQLWALCQNH